MVVRMGIGKAMMVFLMAFLMVTFQNRIFSSCTFPAMQHMCRMCVWIVRSSCALKNNKFGNIVLERSAEEAK